MRRLLDQGVEEIAPQTELPSDSWEQFRQSRLYAQLILAIALVCVFLLAYGLPIDRSRTALRWAVTHETNWQEGWNRAQRWAAARGGWPGAARQLWDGAIKALESAHAWLAEPDPTETAPLAEPGATQTPAAAESKGQAVKPPALIPLQVEVGSGKVMPVDGAVLFGYDWRKNEQGRDELHEGLDLVADAGAPVRAMLTGQVVRVVHRDPVWGGVVEIQHGDYAAIYAGLDAIRVQAGQQVKGGDQIAVVAVKPVAEPLLGPHLHLEVIPKDTGMPIDPAHYLSIQGSDT